MDNVRLTTYSSAERQIVEAGITKIQEALYSCDKGQILSLLFCLERYLDPYYGYKLNFKKELIDLLQHFLLEQDDNEIVEDIVYLLQYSDHELDILATRIDSVDFKFIPDVLNALESTYNKKYYGIYLKYINHSDRKIRETANEIVIEFKKMFQF